VKYKNVEKSGELHIFYVYKRVVFIRVPWNGKSLYETSEKYSDKLIKVSMIKWK